MSDSPNVFISYAREDGAEYSQQLKSALTKDGITCWRDDRIDPAMDFTGEIESALNDATHVAVVVTADLKRADSFVRLEIGYALTHKKPIIPLVFPGGHRPITIINHTYIHFAEWDSGYAMLLERLKDSGTGNIDPATLQEREMAYIQTVGQQYDHWRDLYTDLSAVARVEERKVKPKAAAARYLQMRHKIHQKRDYTPDADKGVTVTTESFDELREGIRKYKRVALIGDPGAGKTTTLERLTYELAASAVDDEGNRQSGEPLPLFVRLGAYDGSDFTQFMESFFGGLPLSNFLPDGVILLLDGLNEMPAKHLGTVEDWLQRHDTVQVIVSCRKLDYVERKLPLQRIDVAPLDLEGILRFLDNYLDSDDIRKLLWALVGNEAKMAWDLYQVISSNHVSVQTPLIEEENSRFYPPIKYPTSIDKIRQRLDGDYELPDMLSIITNPFLLFGMIEIFILEGDVPRHKGDIFRRFVDSLLNELGKIAEREDRPWIPERRQKQALAGLAYRMQSEKTGTGVSLDFVVDTFKSILPDDDPELLLYFAVSANLIEHGSTVRFSHQLLQEYFAAYEMGEDMRLGLPATKYFTSEEWWKTTGWEESAILLAGMEGDASEVVKWLTPVQPDLAYRVATESGAICSDEAMTGLYKPVLGARRSPYALAEWGRKIGENDTRSGVGILDDGLPDIEWSKEIPSGTYTIGGDERAFDALREQNVRFTYNYKLAKYPVTLLQFATFLHADDGIQNDTWWFKLATKVYEILEQPKVYSTHPCTYVCWYQAVAFCRWLTVKYHEANLLEFDHEIRLPTEQEWEVAARYPDRRNYPWGNAYLSGNANCNEEGSGRYYLNCLTAVGLYETGKHSELDLYDLSGSVREWCLNEYYDLDNVDVRGNEPRALRGGGWINDTSYARAASRFNFYPFRVGSFVGFRLCLAPISSLER